MGNRYGIRGDILEGVKLRFEKTKVPKGISGRKIFSYYHTQRASHIRDYRSVRTRFVSKCRKAIRTLVVVGHKLGRRNAPRT